LDILGFKVQVMFSGSTIVPAGLVIFFNRETEAEVEGEVEVEVAREEAAGVEVAVARVEVEGSCKGTTT